MARGALRSGAGTVLALIALKALSTTGGSGRVSGLLRDASSLVDRLLDPNLPAIPDLSSGESWGSGGGADGNKGQLGAALFGAPPPPPAAVPIPPVPKNE